MSQDHNINTTPSVSKRQNETGRTVAYYPVRRELDDLEDSIGNLEVLAIVRVDEDFCFPERTGNTYSVTENGGS